MERDGVITVFLSLILTVILSVMGTCLETARGAGLSCRVQMAASSAVQSVFAGYDSSLFASWQLFFRRTSDRNGSDLAGEMEKCAAACGSASETALIPALDWFAFTVQKAEMDHLVFAVDQNGAVFEAAVMDYMKTGAVRIAWEELSSRLSPEGGGEQSQALAEGSRKEEEFGIGSLWGRYQTIKEQAAASAGKQQEEESEEESEEASAAEPAAVPAGQQEITADNPVEKLQELFKYGILALVMPETSELSGRSLPQEGLPSRLSADVRNHCTDGSPVASGDGSLLLVNEYLIRFLDNALSDKEEKAYDIEYVIAGKASDQENLKAVINRLLWIREFINLAYAMTDVSMKSQADALAVSLAGWTGAAPVVETLSILILAAWSYAEALSDVRILMGGGHVPLWKTSETWHISLQGIMKMGKAGNHDYRETEKKGLSYEDYLRLLLLMTDPSARDYRAMDCIQIHCRQDDPSFSFACCVYAARGTLTAESELLFLCLPGASGLQIGHYSGYQIVRTGSYCYGGSG